MNSMYTLHGIEKFYSINNESVAGENFTKKIIQCNEQDQCLRKKKYYREGIFKAHPRSFAEEILIPSNEIGDVFEETEHVLNAENKQNTFSENDINLEDIFQKVLSVDNRNVENRKDTFRQDLMKIKKSSLENSGKGVILLNDYKPEKEMKEKKQISKQANKRDEQNITENLCNSTKHLIFGEKFNTLLPKINKSIENINNVILTGITPIEDSEDYFRRQKRATEFCSRFSRNYLYQISRQIVTLRKEASAKSVKIPSNLPALSVVGGNFAKVFQLVLNALTAYSNYVPISVEPTVHKKCHELITHIYDIFEILKTIIETHKMTAFDTVVNNIEGNCKTLDELIQEALIKNLGLKNHKKQVSKTAKNELIPKTVPFHKKQTLEQRLSMYCPSGMNVKDLALPKKYTPPLAKRRCKTIRKKTPVEENKIKLAVRSDSTHAPYSYRPTRVNEDDIETMVEREAKRPIDHSSQSKQKSARHVKNGFKKPPCELSPTFYNQMKSTATDEYTNYTAAVDETSTRKLKDRFNDIELQEIDHSKQKFGSRQNSYIKTSPNKMFADQIRVTGPRNAKLYCIKDKSCYESDSAIRRVDRMELRRGRSDETSSKRLTKIQSAMILQIRANHFHKVIDYKMKFEIYKHSKAMYGKFEDLDFCKLGIVISDKLANLVLQHIIREIKFDDFVLRAFRSEFL